MRISHHSGAASPARTLSRRERGYVMAMFGLLLVPILLLSGLAVDVGSWYDRAAQIRKAADAAALAGVVWLPDEGQASAAALAAAQRNGFTNGVDGITVTVTPRSDKRLNVSITDANVGSFFYGQLGGHDISITRSSTAQYTLDVPLGSPRNYFGTGPLVGYPAVTANTELLFQSINPYCTSKVQGDRHQSMAFENSGTPAHCAGTTNADYWNDGYKLFIEVPSGRPAAIDVRLYDARYNNASVNSSAPDERGGSYSIGSYTDSSQCPGTGGTASNGYCYYSSNQRFPAPIAWWNGSSWSTRTTGNSNWAQYFRPYTQTFTGPDSYLSNVNEEDYTFELWAENSPFTDADDTRVCGPTTYSRNTAFEYSYLGSSRWNTLCTIPTAWASGRYMLKARNQGAPNGGNRGNGSNQWGLVARYTDGSGNLGDGLCDGRTWGMCPRVYAHKAMSVYANTTQGTAQFFLAEIEPVHAGKKLKITLWDPGEGGSSLRVLQPSGSGWARHDMTWRSYNNDGSQHLAGQTGVQTIDVTSSKFNGKLLEIEIDLTGYNPSSTNQWWKIEYEFNDPGRPNVTDRTTWSARIEGDPVHLVEEN